MRKKILAANWKMNLTQSEAESYLQSFLSEIRDFHDVDVIIVPPFTAIPAVVAASEKVQTLRVGAQNMHWEKSGAFTGEISATMLRALYVRYVILGHSERRTLFGETDEIVNRKVKAALEAGLHPLFCVGESLRERDDHRVQEVLENQIRKGLAGVSERDFTELVVAYEPVWAIGTGRTATPGEAEEVHSFIRSVLEALSNPTIAERVRIQYGGSVKPENAEALMRQKNIDGALVGGSSLEPRTFAQIIRSTEAALD
jgi:triosephosphate isomerase (TIM)